MGWPRTLSIITLSIFHLKIPFSNKLTICDTPFVKHFDMDKFFEIVWRGRKKVGVGVLLFL